VGRARDGVDDGRLGVAGLNIPRPLEPLGHLVGAEAGDVNRAIGDEALEDRPDIVDAVALEHVLDRRLGPGSFRRR
jgi:hypothetical protein